MVGAKGMCVRGWGGIGGGRVIVQISEQSRFKFWRA